MKFFTNSNSYFEVREVNPNLFRIFYCWTEGYSYHDKKQKEKMISSQDTHKKACKSAKHFKNIYNMGFYDGNSDW